MNDETGGIVEVAKRMYSKEKGDSVTSTVIYGVQWDAIMAWIDPAYKTGSCTEDSFVRDSTGSGNYSGDLAKTGSNEKYSVKNIYDLAGNVDEWTMESSNSNGRVIRSRLFWRYRNYLPS